MIIANSFNSGDTIGIFAPAGSYSKADMMTEISGFKKLGFKATLSNNEYLGVINFNKSGAKILEIAKKFTEKIKANNPKADIFILADSVRNFEKSYYDAYSQFLAKIEKQEGSEFIDRVYRHKGTTKPLSKKELEKQASDYFAQYYRDNKWTGD